MTAQLSTIRARPLWAAAGRRRALPAPPHRRMSTPDRIELPPPPPRWQMALRMAEITQELTAMKLRMVRGVPVEQRAEKMRHTLIRLGPAFVKAGQALATRPDVFPVVVCQALAQLQDKMPPFSSQDARATIESELGRPYTELFSEMSDEPIAAASLGQVYRARLKSTGLKVAVKVQRPGLEPRVVMDAHVMRGLADLMQTLTQSRSDLAAVADQLVTRILEELDYRNEAAQAIKFGKLYRSNMVTVPHIVEDMTTKKVLTMEWVDGVSLADPRLTADMGIEPGPLIELGVQCSLDQMLERGFFHADPHPGNLMVTPEGKLAYLDFGMMGNLDKQTRLDMIQMLVNFVNRDAVGLVRDFKNLKFLPHDAPNDIVIKALHETFNSELGSAEVNRFDFQGVVSQLSSVMVEHKFSIPPHFTMVIRSLAALEGTVIRVDPDFKVVARAYPHVVAQLIRDRSPEMRAILSSLVVDTDGSVRWRRLARLLEPVERPQETESRTFATASASVGAAAAEPKRASARTFGSTGGSSVIIQPPQSATAVLNTDDLISAASDALDYVLSHRGSKVRSGLIRDSVESSSSNLDAIAVHSFGVRPSTTTTSTTTTTDGSTTSFSSSSDPSTTTTTSSSTQPHTATTSASSPATADASSSFSTSGTTTTTTTTAAAGEQAGSTTSTTTTSSSSSSDSDSSTDDDQADSTDTSSGSGGREGASIVDRVLPAMEMLRGLVSEAPAPWLRLLTKTAVHPQAQRFAAELTSAVVKENNWRPAQFSILAVSRALHAAEEERRARDPNQRPQSQQQDQGAASAAQPDNTWATSSTPPQEFAK